ncbi:hypothetical protein Lser_V15G20823 [Lactuca serriola]
MAPPARLNQLQMEQVRNIVVEEFNNAFNELIPGVTNDIINQVKDLLDKCLAAIPGGALSAPPVRDSAYYFEKFSKCSPPLWNGESDPVAAKHWVSDVEGAFMTVGCPDQYKVVIAMNQLRKRGKTWWNTITALLNEEEEFPTLSAIMDAARRREIKLQTQSKRKANDTSSKTSGDAQKKQKQGGKSRYEYRPSSGQGEKNPLICYNCKKPGHHWKNCRAPPASAVPQITSAAPVCYHCNETGHKKPECPKLKAGKGSGGTIPAIASSSKGPTMVTRGRAHQMTADEPVITATVAGTYLLDCVPAVVMFDSGATHSFVSRTFIKRLGCSIGKLARPMVVEVADNRTIYVTDVYRGCTLEFSGVEFPIDLIPIAMRELCIIVGMDWLDAFDAEIHCRKQQVRVRNPRGGELIIQGDIPRLAMAFCSSAIALDDVPIVSDFSDLSLEH